MPFMKMAAFSALFQTQGIDLFYRIIKCYIVRGILRNLWSSSSTLCGILSGPSDLVRLSVLCLLCTAARVMTASGKHTLCKLLAVIFLLGYYLMSHL